MVYVVRKASLMRILWKLYAINLMFHSELRVTTNAQLYLTVRHTKRRGVIAKEIINAPYWKDITQKQMDKRIEALLRQVFIHPEGKASQFVAQNSSPQIVAPALRAADKILGTWRFESPFRIETRAACATPLDANLATRKHRPKLDS